MLRRLIKAANQLDEAGLYDEANEIDRLTKMVSELSPSSILEAIEYASGGVEGYAKEVIEFMHRQQLTDKGGFDWNEFPGVNNWKPIGKEKLLMNLNRIPNSI